VAVLAGHVRLNASRYFPELGDSAVTVRLVHEQRRPQSCLYRFALDSPAARRDVVVKVQRPRGRWDARPRMVRSPDPTHQHEWQYRGMCRIHHHFAGLGDDRFGSIKPLDDLPEHRAFVMGYIHVPTLHRLILNESRLRGPFGNHSKSALSRTFNNAGAWLRAYHDLAPEPGTHVRQPERDEVVELFGRYGAFLGEALRREPFFERMSEAAARRALDTLPAKLPLATGHSDFAPRNVFVGPADRVTVFDAVPRWLVPIFEDVACFTTNLRLIGLQVITLGTAFDRRQLERYRRHFIAGYFGNDEAALEALQVYEILVLLDKWSAVMTAKPRLATLRLAAATRVFSSEFRRLVTQLERY
jgi:hypothetical protein